MIPDWLHFLSLISLLAGGLCAVVIAVDEWRDPQHMWIMNLVWPLVALFASGIALWGYFAYGKLAAQSRVAPAMERGDRRLRASLSPLLQVQGQLVAAKRHTRGWFSALVFSCNCSNISRRR